MKLLVLYVVGCELALVKKAPCGTRKRKLVSISCCERQYNAVTTWLYGVGLAKFGRRERRNLILQIHSKDFGINTQPLVL